MQCLFGQRVKLLGSSLARACHLAFLNHMHEFDAAQQNACTPECLEAEHGASAPFDCPVILFDSVIQILVLADLDPRAALGVQRFKRGQD